MKRGFGTVELVLLLAAIALLVGAWFGVQKAIDDAREEGHAAGRKEALLEVAQRDNAQLVAALARVRELEADKAAQEQKHREAMQQIAIKNQEDLDRVHTEKDRVIAALRSGNLRLRNQGGQADRGCAPGDRGRAAGVADAAPQRDAAPGGEPVAALDRPDDDAVFTVELLAEGDEAIADLIACQKIITDWAPRVHPTASTPR